MQSVYVLIDPRDQLVRYVGRAQYPHFRYYHHIHTPHYRAPLMFSWIHALKNEDMNPVLSIIEEDIDDSSASNREKYWIQYYLDRDAPLLNTFYNPQVDSRLTSNRWKT